MIPRFDSDAWLAACRDSRRPYHDAYYAMFSSVVGGIVTDPVLMLVPIDDHMVHRGDAVFETLKCVRGALYNVPGHLGRLRRSAGRLQLDLGALPVGIETALVETVRAGGRRDCRVSLYVSRGPGSLGPDPEDCRGPQLYVVAARLGKPFMALHPGGARAVTSRVPAKTPYMATVKNCNYLPNVLMVKDAHDRGADFAVAFDDRGCLAEGPTENIGIVSRDRRLLFPRLEGILEGTTMVRVMELAEALRARGMLAGIGFADISREDVLSARECLIVGTTRNVTSVVSFDGHPIGEGVPGPVAKALNRLLEQDILENPAMRTPVWP